LLFPSLLALATPAPSTNPLSTVTPPPNNQSPPNPIVSQTNKIPQLNLTLGQVQRYKLHSIANRINITKSGIVDPIMPDPMTVSIRAIRPGVTSLQVFYENNTQELINVVVSPVDQTRFQTVQQSLQNTLSTYGLKAELLPATSDQPPKIQVSGETLKYNQDCINYIIQPFNDLIDNKVTYTTPKPSPPAVAPLTPTANLASVTNNLPEETPHVQVDTEILIIDLTRARDLGIDWFSNDSSLTFSPLDAVSSTVLTGANPFNINPYKAATVLNFDYMMIQLRALRQEGCTKTLAAPKLITRSGEKASFMAGGEVPITSTTANTSSVTYRKFGTILDTTPTVLPKNRVSVDLKANLSEIDNSIAVNGNPGFEKTEIVSFLTIEDGKSSAVAGHLTRVRNENITRLPFFGRLPIIGQAFRKNINNMVEEQVLVIVTPHILRQMEGCYKEPTMGTPYTRAEVDYMMDDDIFGLNRQFNEIEKRKLSQDSTGNPIYVDPKTPCPTYNTHYDANGFFYDW
jgi:Flp pilus assembly secretin CpaC